MQQFQMPDISTFVKDSLPLLTASITTALSNSSGASFPSTNLQVGMLCVRTDQGQKGRIYELSGYTEDTPPAPVWTLVFDLNMTATSKEYVDNQIATLTNTLNSGLTGAAYYSGLTGPARYLSDDILSTNYDVYPAAGVANATFGTDPSRMLTAYTLPKGTVRAVQDEFQADGKRRWRSGTTSTWSPWNVPVSLVNGASADFPSFYAVAANAAGMRIREVGLAGIANGVTWPYAPKIDFFWSGQVHTRLGINSAGQLQMYREALDTAPATLLHSNNLHTVQKIGYKTADYTLTVNDLSGTYLRMNGAAAMNVIVPTNAAQPIPVGTVVTVRQLGAQVGFYATAGVTISSPETLRMRKAGSTASLIKIDTDWWELSGDLELL